MICNVIFIIYYTSIIGKNENQRQISTRNKRQGKATKLSDRLQVSIDKCGAVKNKYGM